MKISQETFRTALALHQPIVREGQRRAAVAVIIHFVGHQAHLLLTRRAITVSNHKGQVAFPGGGVESGDVDLIDTALRETEEEVGLPRACLTVVGRLDDIFTVTGETVVTPVVAFAKDDELPPMTAQPSEVARIFSIPFRDLLEDSLWRTEQTHFRGRTYPLYYFDYDGETLWGLSAFIVRQMLSICVPSARAN